MKKLKEPLRFRNVLQHVQEDDAVRGHRRRDVLSISVDQTDSGLLREAVPQQGEEIRGGFDENHTFGVAVFQEELRERADAGPDLNDVPTQIGAKRR